MNILFFILSLSTANAVCVGTNSVGDKSFFAQFNKAHCTQKSLRGLHKRGTDKDVKKLNWKKLASCDNGLTTVQLRPHIVPQNRGQADGFEVGLIDPFTQSKPNGLRTGDVVVSVNQTVGDIPRSFAMLRNGNNYLRMRRGSVERDVKFSCKQ